MRAKRVKDKVSHRLKCRRGISLVEALVTVLIFSVLAAAVNTVLLVGESSWQTNSVQMELHQDLRKAMDWMKDDLRQTGPAAISDGPEDADDTAYSSITFQKATGISGSSIEWGGGDPDATTQFILGGTQLQKIVRDDDGNIASTTVLAQNIQSVQFTRSSATSDVIEVELDAQKNTIKGRTITASLDFEVQMRN